MLGTLASARVDNPAALAAFDSEVGILERGLGREHPTLAGPLINRGLSYLDLGRLDEAEADLLRAEALLAALPGDSPDLAHPLVGLGGVALRRGDGLKARTMAERASAYAAREARDPTLLADVAWLHARALRMIGEEPERAVALGQTALTICREKLAATPENRAFAAEIEAWLAGK